jgi:hypothetical protein
MLGDAHCPGKNYRLDVPMMAAAASISDFETPQVLVMLSQEVFCAWSTIASHPVYGLLSTLSEAFPFQLETFESPRIERHRCPELAVDTEKQFQNH